MKIPSIENYKREFNITRILFVVLILINIGANLYFKKQLLVEKAQYIVLDQENNPLFAEEKLLTPEQKKAKIKDHVSDFYRLFFEFGFQLSGERSWEVRTKHALFLIDDSGYILFNKYKEDNLYQTIVENQYSLTIDIQSIDINMNTLPISGQVMAVQTLNRPAGKKKRNMHATFNIIEVGIEEENPHGYQITNFNVYNNEEVED